MTVEFFMPMKPPTVTHQEKKVRVVNGKPKFYEPAELSDARDKLMAYLGRYSPAEPLAAPVRLTVRWLYPKGRRRDGEYKTTKPDLDNAEKLLLDCMTRTGFWPDDAVVASKLSEKFWAATPGIYIKVEEITN